MKQEDAAPWREGWDSAKALLRPGIFLQAVAVGIVLVYYFVPAAGPAFLTLARWKANGGYAFSALASVLCGGIIPFIYLESRPELRQPRPVVQFAFYCLFWAWKGAEVDLWYRILGAVFGSENRFGIVALKVLCDQFLYNPLYTTPVGNLLFAWKDAGFRVEPVREDLRAGRWYRRRVIPALIAVWSLWIPVVCCVFALPALLQVPLFNVVLCFWSMLYISITRRQNAVAA
ncbi:MAG TPA: hypothetical protein VHD32_10950 [Candidatus Didemnitutus sp.]|nr:hypothetical protein [Candidatus Didemnitutus sp.]